MSNRKASGRDLGIQLGYYKATCCPVFLSVSKVYLAAIGRYSKAVKKDAKSAQTNLFQ